MIGPRIPTAVLLRRLRNAQSLADWCETTGRRGQAEWHRREARGSRWRLALRVGSLGVL